MSVASLKMTKAGTVPMRGTPVAVQVAGNAPADGLERGLASLCARAEGPFGFHPGSDFAADVRGERTPALAPLLAVGQGNYPERPIKLMVAFSAGGVNDVVARQWAERVKTLLGTVYSESFYWLALPTVVICVTLVMGPIFCGWICPTGAIQEWSAMLRRRLLPRRLTGTVDRFFANKGFGFLRYGDGQSIFFHVTQCEEGGESPTPGTQVSFSDSTRSATFPFHWPTRSS